MQEEHTPHKTVREYALDILYRVDAEGSFANLLLNDAFRFQPEDEHMRPFLTQLVKGTLEWRSRIDAVLNTYLTSPLERMKPRLKNILRLGAYEVLYLQKVPKEVSVNEAVELAKRYAGGKGPAALVNAVLRKVAAAPPPAADTAGPALEDIAAFLGHPAWVLKLWRDQLGMEQAKALAEADNERWPQCIRTNTLRIARAELQGKLSEEGVQTDPGKYAPGCLYIRSLPKESSIARLKSFEQGLFTIQDESSALVAMLYDLREADFVIDLCSAPGGKAAAAAAHMRDAGIVVAVDPHPNRLSLVKDICRRLGLTSVLPVAGDGRSIPFSRLADKVLIDAPCSGLGTLGHKADAKWHKKEKDIGGLRALQAHLLNHAATLVRRGGRLIYSTCTINRMENQDTISRFLAKHPNFRLVPAQGILPAEVVNSDGFLETFPHIHGIAGAFGAVLEETSTH